MVDKEKKLIRKQIRELKKKYSLEEKKTKSKRIFEKVEQLESFKKAQIVLAYWSMSDEVHTHEFVARWYKEKTFLLPVVKGDVLELRYFSGTQNMIEGAAFSIEEPTGEVFTRNHKIDFIVVPGVAFDNNKNRLGRGKAYYDKLLTTTHNATKAGVCFDFQLIKSVPVDEYDVKMDMVVTDA